MYIVFLLLFFFCVCVCVNLKLIYIAKIVKLNGSSDKPFDFVNNFLNVCLIKKEECRINYSCTLQLLSGCRKQPLSRNCINKSLCLKFADLNINPSARLKAIKAINEGIKQIPQTAKSVFITLLHQGRVVKSESRSCMF